MPKPRLTPEIIAAAIDGYEAQRVRIDAQIAELRQMLNGGPAGSAATSERPARKRRKFSAATRKRMKEAQQRRWDKIRSESESAEPATAKPKTPKRRISEEGMKRIIAATKKRWRLQKTAAKAKSPAKKVALKKAAVKSVPAKAANKRLAVKKAAVKNTAPVRSQTGTETADQ